MLGLGTGSTAGWFVRLLSERIRREGLSVEGVATSSATVWLAEELGVPLRRLDDVELIDLVVDGADEIDARLNLIKGGGAALLQEKIVAAASARMVVIADDSKRVAHLGRFPLPVEIVRFGWTATRRAGRGAPRLHGRGRPPGRRAHGQGRAARHRRGQLHPRPAPRPHRRRAARSPPRSTCCRGWSSTGSSSTWRIARCSAAPTARPRCSTGPARAGPTPWTSPSSCATRTPEAVPGTSFDFDLFVIGGGSGGVRAARIAAEHGARVGLAEEYRYGGTCVIRGCIPKKLLVYASAFADAFADARGYGWTVEKPRFDWSALVAAKDAEISRLEAVYHDRLRRAGVQLCAARATVLDPHRVRLATGAEYSASHLLVATGGRPLGPGDPGRRARHHLERDLRPRDAAEADAHRRRRLCRLRVRRHHERPRHPRHPALPRRPDPARLRRRTCATTWPAPCARAGSRSRSSATSPRVEKVEGGLRVSVDNGETHVVDQVLFATGRRPEHRRPRARAARREARRERRGPRRRLVADGGALDLRGGRRHRPVAADARWRSTRARPSPTPSSAAGRGGRTMRMIPTAIFTQPEAATLGLSEADAARRARSRSTAPASARSSTPSPAARSGR